MTIEDYTNNKGVAPIVLGQARILQSNIQFLHIINVTTYLPIAMQNNDNLNKIERQIKVQNNTNLIILFSRRIRTLRKEAITLIETIQILTPKIRKTRGIHIIFGDIVQADTEQINNALKNIHTNENMIISKINEQVEINKNMINRFREIENHIQGEVQSLTLGINKATVRLDEIEMTLITEQNLHAIEYVIRNLQQHIDEIIDSIALAKQGYISHYILTKEESNFAYENLEKQNIQINSEHELYQFLTIKTYFKDPLVVFSILIPQYSNKTFQNIKLFPLTINNTFTIKMPSKYIHTHKNIAKYSDENCDKIDDTYFCKEEEIYTAHEKCVVHIITNEPAECQLIEGNINNYIQQVEQKFIVINADQPPEFKTDCGNQSSKFLPTQCIVKIESCSISINNITYSNTGKQFKEVYTYIPYNELKITNKTKALSSKQLSKMTIENMDKIAFVKQEVIPQTHHYTAWSITTIIIIGLIIYLCTLRYCPSCTPCQWYTKIKKSPDFQQLTKTLKDTNFIEDNKNLGQGELCSPAVPSSPNYNIYPTLPTLKATT